MSKMSLEENTEYSNEILAPMMKLIDKAVNNFDVKRLKETLKEMEGQASTLRALPFPETQDKADEHELTIGMYRQILVSIEAMIEIRIKQRDLAGAQQGGTAGAQILKQLGVC